MKRSTSLQIALYRDSSKRAAEWARRKMAELQARGAVAGAQPAPRWGYAVLAALVVIGITAVIVAFSH